MASLEFPKNKLEELQLSLAGTLYFDDLLRTIYATDASVYSVMPLAVAYPKNEEDIKKLIRFARKNDTSLIPRTAGTSLAGQCVGDGIVVDVSKHFTKILELDVEQRRVRVQPGVVRDELNRFLKPHGLFFSPITSTANRAMIGGMVGNNSSGTTSIVYGTTREHVLELKTILSDGSEAVFSAIDNETFQQKLKLENLEGEVYRQISDSLKKEGIAEKIRDEFPKPEIHRRNTGYAIDYLSDFFENPESKTFDFCKLLCGSEGTLAFTTEIVLELDPLPEPCDVIVAAHFSTVRESMLATRFAMQFRPTACELMDKIILDCTKDNAEQLKNRSFVVGDPKTVLLVEFRGKTPEEAEKKADELIAAFDSAEVRPFAAPKIFAPETKGVWALRSAGLGLLANIPGDRKAVACIEDTAVALDDLADYIDDFAEIMSGFGQEAVYYAHAGAGEIHLRPILDLKKSEDVAAFYKISEASAKLVKKYGGSLSGEHGDGRVRAPFIPLMVGEEIYELFKQIKYTWDSAGIFNPGKIVNAPAMNESLRYEPDREIPDFETIMDFSATGGILRMAEKCNGSGDCRKLPESGGTMCPSYQATRNEKDTTRARANTLRNFLSKNTRSAPFAHKEIKEVMDLCLSCKGCTSECPSNVDMASLKAEFLYQFYKTNGVPFRAKVFANINRLNALGALLPGLTNWFLAGAPSGLLKKILAVAPQRTLPKLQSTTLRKWYANNADKISVNGTRKKIVYLFCDEFTDYNDTEIGVKTIKLLSRLGYEVRMTRHLESGRAAISKGLLEQAKKSADANVKIFSDFISKEVPLIGVEPSAILSFRDEYPRLVSEHLRESAEKLKNHTCTIEEFIADEVEAGNISAEQFHDAPRQVLVHGHCHQKALSSIDRTAWILSLPRNYNVEIISSGCCGMAGSFGYEKEHYEISMQVGDLVLFPKIRAAETRTIIAAAGTSCRHQIADGTGRKSLHPVEVLSDALL